MEDMQRYGREQFVGLATCSSRPARLPTHGESPLQLAVHRQCGGRALLRLCPACLLPPTPLRSGKLPSFPAEHTSTSHRICCARPAFALLFLLGTPICVASLSSCNNHFLDLIHTLFLFLSRLSHEAAPAASQLSICLHLSAANSSRKGWC